MNAIACPNHDTLHAYLLGNLDDGDLDAHLDACADCQAALDEIDAAVNQPFACLRAPAALDTDWQHPTFHRLVAQAKALGTPSLNGHATLDADSLESQTIGNYLLQESVGAGGMGRVYKAQHLRLKKTVAVKLLMPQLLRSPEGRRRFQREVEAVGRLASPHIVTAFDAGEADGRDFLVMEYVEGKNLAELVKERGPLPIDEALDYILQTARGLQHAHAAGIIHRDVKPSNLLLDASGTVKVLDLGLALVKFHEAEPPDQDATGNVIMGTVAFMAPEQALNTHLADERADVYSLGCTLFFLLVGKPPYEGSTPTEMLVAHREQPIPSLCTVRLDCPPTLDALLRRLIAKTPDQRPASMAVVIAELERVRQRVPARRLSPWRGVIAAGITAAACVLVAFGLWAGGVIPGAQKKDDPSKKDVATLPKKGPVIDMASIEPGTFSMGASDSDRNAEAPEKPRRKIKINQAFSLGKTEVTQAQYEEVMGTNPSAFSAKGKFKDRVKGMDTGNHPVDSVSWLDAVRFCNRLSERHELEPYYKIVGETVTINGGTGYRLPTEAEWEFAARAGATTTWHFGENADDLKEHAWYEANSDDRTHPVAQKKANKWGLYDMLGNVPEWCWDRYDPEYYKNMPASDPPGSGTGRERVFRGASWNSPLPRTSMRNALGPILRFDHIFSDFHLEARIRHSYQSERY